ncbi:MAG TPA: hypothetical protein VK308_13180 [Pyrinomonadaceae bacterium]|nr:hypothetical protein [Pyrinomonadaceae bacterium]
MFEILLKAEAIEKHKRTIQIKKTEILYKTAPKRESELINEGIFVVVPRNDDEMAWAENHHVDLGFQIGYEANIKSHINEQKNPVVYADP